MNQAKATPQFARETNLSCNSCHRHIPLLNEFGQRFYANGFRISKDDKMTKTIPAWGSLGAQATYAKSLGSSVPVSWATTEIASYEFIDQAKLLYHFEYQPTTQQTYIYGIHPFNKSYSVQVGEVGLLSQYDPRLDVFISRPIYLSPGGAGYLGNGKNGPFAPGSNAYAVRGSVSLTGDSALPYSDGWKVAGTIPFSNEAPCGLTPDFNKHPGGVFLEGFRRMGMNSYGVNMFTGQDGRRYYSGVVQEKVGKTLFFEGGVSYASFLQSQTSAASIGTTWTPAWNKAFSLRVDDQDGYLNLVPNLSLLIGGKNSALMLVGESTITHGVGPTTVVTAQLKF